MRWYCAAKTLGWGILCLLPYNVITNSWVENEVRSALWPIWLQLVNRENPNACKASMALDAWLGSEGIAGGPISAKETLYIEASIPVPATQVEEVGDSDDSSEDLESTQTQASIPHQLRQLTLLELCKPQARVNSSI